MCWDLLLLIIQCYLTDHYYHWCGVLYVFCMFEFSPFQYASVGPFTNQQSHQLKGGKSHVPQYQLFYLLLGADFNSEGTVLHVLLEIMTLRETCCFALHRFALGNQSDA